MEKEFLILYKIIPKQMIKIGIPLLTHIMRMFKDHGYNDFLIKVIKKMLKKYFKFKRI